MRTRTFTWLRVLLAAHLLAGCHPGYHRARENLVNDGSGGSGGLSSVRMKVLAAIAARDYAHARHLVELAADLGERERALFEQMISAAERGFIPFLEQALPHIFRAGDPGHFAQDTAEARELIQATAVETCFVGIRKGDVRVYQRILDTGSQIWVYVFDGTIRDAGTNDVPRSAERLLQ